MRPPEWAAFVQAGMNDIDRRCDAYLTWLDNKRRWREPVLSEFVAASAATAAILGLTGVGAAPIAIVGTAFGFAKESFVNLQSRLLTEIDHSVVQAVVLGNQSVYRNDVARLVVDNRPAAIYLLRGYLRLCMPMSIEMHINNTMTVFQRGGAPALGANRPILEQVPVVAKPVVARTIVTNGAPLTPTERIKENVRIEQPRNALYSQFIVGYNPNIHNEFLVTSALRALCVPAGDFMTIPRIVHLIDVYEQLVYEGASAVDLKRQDHKLDTGEISTLAGSGPCDPQFRNYYERMKLRTPNQVMTLISGLNRVPGGPQIIGNTLQSARAKIAFVRDKFFKEGAIKATSSRALEDEVTVELVDALPP
jgi:hypothetical protein